jgi:hypothetical protein
MLIETGTGTEKGTHHKNSTKLQPTIYNTRGENANHYTTDAVLKS